MSHRTGFCAAPSLAINVIHLEGAGHVPRHTTDHRYSQFGDDRYKMGQHRTGQAQRQELEGKVQIPAAQPGPVGISTANWMDTRCTCGYGSWIEINCCW